MLQEFIKLCNLPESIMEKLAFFPYEFGIILNCTDGFTARWIARHSRAIERAMKELKIYYVIITVRGQIYWPISINKNSALKIKNEVTAMLINTKNLIDIDLDSLDLSRPHLILTELYQLKYPAFITALGIEESLFYNQAEVLCMPNVPASKFLTYTQSLTYPEELENRNRLLRADGRLKDYSHKGMRWYIDGDTLRKKEMSFLVDYCLCEYLGQPARIGIVKNEEELRRFVD